MLVIGSRSCFSYKSHSKLRRGTDYLTIRSDSPDRVTYDRRLNSLVIEKARTIMDRMALRAHDAYVLSNVNQKDRFDAPRSMASLRVQFIARIILRREW